MAWLPVMALLAVGLLLALGTLLGEGERPLGLHASGDFVEPRTMETVLVAVPLALVAAGWPLAVAMLPIAGVRLRATGIGGFAPVIGAFVGLGLYIFIWMASVYVPCRENCGAYDRLSSSLAVAGMVPLVFVACAPLAVLLASGTLALQHRQRNLSSDALVTEVRTLYANGRLARGDYERVDQMQSAVVDSAHGAGAVEFRGALQVYYGLLVSVGTIGAGTVAAIFFDSGVGLAYAFCLAAVAGAVWLLMRGIKAWSTGRELADLGLKELSAAHVDLVHKASGHRVPPAPGATGAPWAPASPNPYPNRPSRRS